VRTALIIFTLALSGCASKPIFYDPPDFTKWMQRALREPNSNPCYFRFSSAYHGDPTALSAYFKKALDQANTPLIDAEGSEALSFELQTILHKLGDTAFAKALSLESPETRSATSFAIGLSSTTRYPLTHNLLETAPKIDFPLIQTIRNG